MERKIVSVPKPLENSSLKEPNLLLHELLIHQKDLEKKNQQLQGARKSLEEERNQYADLFDFAPVAYFILDKKGFVVNVNLTGCSLLGVERAKLKGKSFSLFVSSREGERRNFVKYLNKVFQSKSIQAIELRLKDNKGIIFSSQLESVTMGDDNVKSGFCRMTLRDIRHEKRTERLEQLINELFHEKEIAHRYLELSGVFFVSLDTQGAITMINQTGKQILGYEVNNEAISVKPKIKRIRKLEGLKWFETFIPEPERELANNLFQKFINGEPGLEYVENDVLCRDGSRRTILWHNILLFDETSKITGTLSSGTDITIRKQEEDKLLNTVNALHLSDQRFRNVFENVNDAILIIDAETSSIINVNKKLIDYLGYSKLELLNMKIFDLYPEEEVPHLKQNYEFLKDKGQALFEAPKKRKDGTVIRMEVNSCVIDYDGKKAFLNVARDLSERKKVESYLMAALLEGQEKERQRIAADLHDGIHPLLSTIKRKIESYIPFFKEQSVDNKKGYRYIVSLLDRTLKEVRAISYNLASPALQDFGLVATLHDLCETLNETGKATVNFYSAGLDNKMKCTVATGLYRVAQELLLNAIKHANAKTITLQLIKHAESVILMIEDDGIGFDKSVKSKGIGLPSISARVKAMEGTLEVDSMKGRGSIITVEVPFQQSGD